MRSFADKTQFSELTCSGSTILVDRLAPVLRKSHRGPQPSAVLKPSSAAKLRAVK
jgi:hypothetical protein